VPYDLLEFVNAFSDEHGNIVRAPFDIQLPMEMFTGSTLRKDGKTTITANQSTRRRRKSLPSYQSIQV
jgi:hypothetical protein